MPRIVAPDTRRTETRERDLADRVVAPDTHRTETRERDLTNLSNAASVILALQRSAGNAAIVAWLRQAPTVALQRDRKLPAEPRTLSDFSSVAKEVSINDDEVTLGNLQDYFKGGRGHDRAGIATEVRFSQDMAAKPGDDKIETKVRDGLASIALGMFNLHSVSVGAPTVDVTMFRDLDLTGFGGQDGRYRFTSVARKFVGKGAKRTPSEVDVVVERLGPRRPMLLPWKALDAKVKSGLQKRFVSFGYTQQSADIKHDDVVDWREDQFGMVLQALEYVPSEALRNVPDIVWTRGLGKTAPDGESCTYYYNTKPPLVRRITVFDSAFDSDDALRNCIAHEIGHAVSYKPAEAAGHKATVTLSADYQKAAKLDGGLQGGITAYGRKNWNEHYAEAYAYFVTEPDTFKTLRPNLFAWFTRQQTAAPVPKAAPAKATPKPGKK